MALSERVFKRSVFRAADADCAEKRGAAADYEFIHETSSMR